MSHKRRPQCCVVAGALLLTLLCNRATAADLPGPTGTGNEVSVAPLAVPPTPPLISEIRFGVLYHEDSRLRRVFFNQNKPRERGYADINGEVLFQRPQWHFDNWLMNVLLTPRLHVSTSINTGRGTSQASIGLAWDTYIYKTYFFEATFDLAFHNGFTGDGIPPDNRRNLGCSPLSRQSFWLGKDIDEHWRVMVGIEHLDNFHLCRADQGLSNLGARIGYRF